MGAFDDMVVIVTGGALGMGRATAVEFVKQGAAVVVADVNKQAGLEVQDEMRSFGRGIFLEADVSESAACQSIVRDSVREFGGVDILFNNVGIHPGDSYVSVVDLPEEMWDRILNVNLKSHFMMAKYSIPEMRKRGGGVIINNASVQGLQSMPGVAAYAASKGGILSLNRQLALDFAVDGIRVLAICPGTIDTPLVRQAIPAGVEDVETAVRQAGEGHPIGRIGTAQEIANVVTFLASDRASFMTGEYVCVDGGYMAQGAWSSQWR